MATTQKSELKDGEQMTETIQETYNTNVEKLAQKLDDGHFDDDGDEYQTVKSFILETSEFEIGDNNRNKPEVPDFDAWEDVLQQAVGILRVLIVDGDSVYVFKYDKMNEQIVIETSEGDRYDSDNIVKSAFTNAAEGDAYIIPITTPDLKTVKQSVFK